MHKRSQGLTLIEMLIVVALLSLMAQLSVPAWQDFISKQRAQTLLHSLERAVQQTRNLAITHRTGAELCGSLDGRTCHSDWSSGWLIRLHRPQSPQPEVLHYQHLNSSGLRLSWSGFQPRIFYHANGLSTASNGRFYLCRQHSLDWQLILNRQGRVRRASNQENRQADMRCQG